MNPLTIKITRNSKPLLYLIAVIFICFSFLSAPFAGTPETVITTDSIKNISLTIYNRDLALVRDVRQFKLPKGEIILAYSGISARIMPETALFKAKGVNILEQNFEYDLLTPDSLLRKYVGRQVEIIKKHPTTGEETTVPATVLSTNNGVVLKVGNRIETGIPGRLAFPDVPENLRVKPTLCLLAKSSKSASREMELTYLTTGLGWQADYVAELNNAENSIDLRGWVTLKNNSGTTYSNARLQLVAGDVHRVTPEGRPRAMLYKSASPASVMDSAMKEESLLDFHLYTLGRTTTIKNKQSKQVSLLEAASVPCVKEYIVRGNNAMFTAKRGDEARKIKVGVFLTTENTRTNHLGIPMPAGTVRVYKKDSVGALQFVGEDRIDHTPENEDIRLKLGDAFDVTAWRKQTDFKKVSGFSGYNYTYEAAFEVVIKNALKKEITVQVRDTIPGDWNVKSESLPHKKLSAHAARWDVKVPAKGSATLTYRVLVKY